MNNSWQKKCVFITGATGFIGSHLTERLLDLGAEVHISLRRQSKLDRLENFQNRIACHQVNLSSSSECLSIFEELKPELVFNFAAQGVLNPDSDRECIQQNVVSTMALLNAAERVGVRRFIQAGSCFEYGAGKNLKESDPTIPTNFYAISKLASTLLAKNFFGYGLPTVALRIFTPYGPRESESRLVSSTIVRALKGDPILATGGEQRRDLIFINDLIEGILRATSTEKALGKIINLGSGRAYAVREIIEKIVKLCDSKSVVKFGALPYRQGEMFENSSDTTLAEAILDWKATTSLDQGLQRSIEAINLKKSF